MRGDDNQPEGSLAASPARSETSGSSLTTDPQDVDEIQQRATNSSCGITQQVFYSSFDVMDRRLRRHQGCARFSR